MTPLGRGQDDQPPLLPFRGNRRPLPALPTQMQSRSRISSSDRRSLFRLSNDKWFVILGRPATVVARASAAVWSCVYATGAWPTDQRRAWLCPNCCRQTAARLTLTIARPLLDLVVIAMVREQWLVGFLVPVAHYAARTRMRCFRMIDCSSSRL